MPDKKIIQIKNLKKYYPLPRKEIFQKPVYLKAVNDISFEIYEGETFGLVGESGCGKSTTGHLLIRLLESTDGRILFEEEDITHAKGSQLINLRKKMQIIFQDPYGSLNPRKKIGWILEEPLRVNQIGTPKERKEKIIEMLPLIGFDKTFLQRYSHELSGGQRQRVGILNALMLNPKFIVADEAVSALDVSVQSQILNLMKKLQHSFGLTYLFISHDLNVVHYMSDRIGVMYLGKIVETADVHDLYSNPLHPYTRSLLASIPEIHNTQKREKIILKGDIPNPSSLPPGCPFYTRCPDAMNQCKEIPPKTTHQGARHYVSCHLY